ncbi:hypothetical protein V3C99_017857 [Haemonchus contortus]|uniref:Nuclease n=1 Tax=Haemonchus contortus TaxID=6289 RepID=A0A7I4Z439_HAECO
MEVNGKRILFEFYAGASLSIIDEKTWHKLGRPQLQKAEVAATAFAAKRSMLQGKVPLQFEYAEREAMIDVRVSREQKLEETLAGIKGVLIYLDDNAATGLDEKTPLRRLKKSEQTE